MINIPVTVPASATSNQTFARFRWSTEKGLNSKDIAPDGEIEDYAVTINSLPSFKAKKDVTVWDPSSIGLYALPGNDVIYTIIATNAGPGMADPDTMELIDAMPSEVEFYNGDIDDGGPETDPVSFVQSSGAGLTFNYAGDVAYSNSAAPPANFSACSYAPSAGYDPNVTFICFNPKGTLITGSPSPTFEVSFRARIK